MSMYSVLYFVYSRIQHDDPVTHSHLSLLARRSLRQSFRALVNTQTHTHTHTKKCFPALAHARRGARPSGLSRDQVSFFFLLVSRHDWCDGVHTVLFVVPRRGSAAATHSKCLTSIRGSATRICASLRMHRHMGADLTLARTYNTHTHVQDS